MQSHCGRYVMVFNGEIYNHRALRQELEADGDAPQWRGESDSETLLALFSAVGISGALDRLVGMFAVAVFDRKEKTLSLTRDRMGEKPLYFGWVDGGFAFASELKAISTVPGFHGRIDRAGLGHFVRYGFVPAPNCIWQDLYKLEAGCLLTLSLEATKAAPAAVPSAPMSEPDFAIQRYWDVRDAMRAGAGNSVSDKREAQALLHAQLRDTVQLQAQADVPVGAFLSGGCDSSLICALLQESLPGAIDTFTLGFDEARLDESPYARAVAQHLGTRHHEMMVTARDAQDVIPDLPSIYDEPFADSSQIPTFLVCKMARRNVTVSLSGDGGDELFGGYDRYDQAAALWPKLTKLPVPARKALGKVLAMGLHAPGLGKMDMRQRGRLEKLGAILSEARTLDDLYEQVMRIWPAKGPAAPLPHDVRTDWSGVDLDDPVTSMMLADQRLFLPDDIMVKVDRAAMAVSLETRAPLLDHRLVELAWRFPSEWKAGAGQSKDLLREILYEYVPRDYFDRPKAGFSIPVGTYLRGPLRDWAEALLAEERLAENFYPVPIRRRWAEHLSGARDWTQSLWAICMFEAWRESATAAGNASPALN